MTQLRENFEWNGKTIHAVVNVQTFEQLLVFTQFCLLMFSNWTTRITLLLWQPSYLYTRRWKVNQRLRFYTFSIFNIFRCSPALTSVVSAFLSYWLTASLYNSSSQNLIDEVDQQQPAQFQRSIAKPDNHRNTNCLTWRTTIINGNSRTAKVVINWPMPDTCQ